MALLMEIRGTPLESSYTIDAVAEAFELARREQDTRRQLSALSERLDFQLSLVSNEQDAKTIESLKAQIKKLEKLHGSLMEELEDAFPDYLALINSRPVALVNAQSALCRNEALLAIYTAGEKTYVWAVPASGNAAASVVDIGRGELAQKVAVLRTALDPNALTLGEIPAFDPNRAYDLYRLILEPPKSTVGERRESHRHRARAPGSASPRADVYLGERANEDAVKAMKLDDRRVFATDSDFAKLFSARLLRQHNHQSGSHRSSDDDEARFPRTSCNTILRRACRENAMARRSPMFGSLALSKAVHDGTPGMRQCALTASWEVRANDRR